MPIQHPDLHLYFLPRYIKHCTVWHLTLALDVNPEVWNHPIWMQFLWYRLMKTYMWLWDRSTQCCCVQLQKAIWKSSSEYWVNSVLRSEFWVKQPHRVPLALRHGELENKFKGIEGSFGLDPRKPARDKAAPSENSRLLYCKKDAARWVKIDSRAEAGDRLGKLGERSFVVELCVPPEDVLNDTWKGDG